MNGRCVRLRRAVHDLAMPDDRARVRDSTAQHLAHGHQPSKSAGRDAAAKWWDTSPFRVRQPKSPLRRPAQKPPSPGTTQRRATAAASGRSGDQQAPSSFQMFHAMAEPGCTPVDQYSAV
ncbi:hypothetical protein GCM10009838_30530 [Catenulispora subtropica]|uniref:Uncharacterized protein n=1 Tax=Catenulispora subtropica TaxID=450798 RepID=A0ABP5CY20_9ACTN